MGSRVWCYLWVTIVYTSNAYGITTVHHDKPYPSNIATATDEAADNLNITLSPSERQKRLLSYQNFYITPLDHKQPPEEPIYEPITHDQRFQFHNTDPEKTYDISYQNTQPEEYHQSNNKFTPFSARNALPGPFKPMLNDQKIKVQYVSIPQPRPQKIFDYSAIYDKLVQLKYQQSRRPYVQTFRPAGDGAEPQRYVSKPQVSFVPPRNTYKSIQPSKTTIETFTATNIDIPSGQDYYRPASQQYIKATPVKHFETDYYEELNTKPYVNQQIAVEIPHSSFPQKSYNPVLVQTPYRERGELIRKPYIVVQTRHQEPEQQTPQRQVILIQRPTYRNKPSPQVNKEYFPISYVPKYGPVTETDEPQYEEYQTDSPVDNTNTDVDLSTVQYEYQTIKSVTDPPKVESITPKQEYQPVNPDISHHHDAPSNSNRLGHILKQLQAANTLPHTLTADNIDNSIKTLVRILESLKKQQKLSKPIVVEDAAENYEDDENETGAGVSEQMEDLPGTVSQKFPADSPEGGTPGKPGVDYPALSNIPQTSFNCKTQRYKGFFGDPDTNCQVWHYCDLNGGQASFLCPNGTIFSQVALTCDWWYNVKCSSTAQLYVLNERLYKYIIPLSPKFPEDYSGPLVDKYLALKFQEMEEKMRKEKKDKENSSKEKENEELQDIEITQKEPESRTPTPKSQGRETLETIEDDNDQE